jgi:hypothetical protein
LSALFPICIVNPMSVIDLLSRALGRTMNNPVGRATDGFFATIL